MCPGRTEGQAGLRGQQWPWIAPQESAEGIVGAAMALKA